MEEQLYNVSCITYPTVPSIPPVYWHAKVRRAGGTLERLCVHTLQQSTSPSLRGTIPLLAVLTPEVPGEEEFFGVEVEHDPCEPLIGR